MRASNPLAFGPGAILAAMALGTVGGGCSSRILVVVEPDPCAANDAGLPACIPPGLLDGLVGYWLFDDGPGSTVARDSSGHGNHGTLHNLDPSTAWVAGRSGGAINIGAAGWIEVPDSASIDVITDQITLAAWVYLDGTISSTDLYGTAISRQIGTGIDQHYHLSLNVTDRANLFITTSGGTDLLHPTDQNSSVPAVPQRVWTHIAGTYDGSTVRLYANGAELPNFSMPLGGLFQSDSTPVILGGNGNNNATTELFPGRLDEIMLYRRALSGTEIAELAAGVPFTGGPLDAGTD